MKNESRPEGEHNETTAPPPAPAVRSAFAGRPWVVVLLALWTLANAGGFAYFRTQGPTAEEAPSPEIDLGSYSFRADAAERGPVTSARFCLHISFAPQSDRDARQRLAARKFRLQQDVEELLRRAHGADFDDPRLRELKRQIQEQVNETLGMRAVADVIITGLVREFPLRAAAHRETSDGAEAPSKPRE